QCPAHPAMDAAHSCGHPVGRIRLSEDGRVHHRRCALEPWIWVIQCRGGGEESCEGEWVRRLHEQRPRAGEGNHLLAVNPADDRVLAEVTRHAAYVSSASRRLGLTSKTRSSPVRVSTRSVLGTSQTIRSAMCRGRSRRRVWSRTARPELFKKPTSQRSI